MTLSAEAFLKNGRKYLNSAVDSKDVITVAADNGNAVIINEDEYAKTLELLEVLETLEALKEADEQLERGEILTMENVFGELDQRIAELQAQQK
ncbi:MAG: hypothetical protein LBS99_01190 [Clostridiales bacterium]|jgi:PHD/YefM family antitoxin component YafN of YafNO toxin-antitoxin module|nr:hypothetical protein [Clostridiales bacterium]